MFVFRAIPFRCVAERTTLTRKILVSGLVFPTDRASSIDTRDSRQSPETRRFQVKWVVLYSQTTKITTQRVRFPRVPVLRPFRGEVVLTPHHF